MRAADCDRSMENEAREIIRIALAESSPIPSNLAESIRKRFADFGDFDLPEIPRELLHEPQRFD